MKTKNLLSKLIIFLSILLIFSLSTQAQSKILLKELNKPDSVSFDQNNMYITDNATIFIYNLKDLTLKTKFGKIGEGPGEFLGNARTTRAPLTLSLKDDQVIVNSYNKLSYFDKTGKLIKELRPNDRSTNFKPLGQGYAGRLIVSGEKMRYRTLNVYDSELNGRVLLKKVPHPLRDRRKGFMVMEAPMSFATSEKKLFAAFDMDFIIRVYNEGGEEIYKITPDYQRLKVTEKDKHDATQFIKTNPRFKSILNILLPLYFPSYRPALLNILVSDNKLYAITEKNKNGNNECYIFTLKGKLLQKKVIDIKYKNKFDLCAHNIKNGKLYQLVEDVEKEQWHLLITKI